MKIIELQALRHANVFSYKPVLHLKVFLGQAVDTPSSAIAGFVENLLAVLPGLREHQCSVGRKGGFVERLREGTYPAHILEHVILELQNVCGDNVAYGKARATRTAAVYDVIVAYEDLETARRCAYLAEKLMNALLAGRSMPIEAELEKIKASREKNALGPSAQAIYDAAQKRGVPVERFGYEDLLFLGQGRYRKKIWSAVTEATSLLAADLVGNKYLTTKLLTKYGVPVPQNEIVETEAEAVGAWRRMGGTVVVKPLDGSHGRGVTVDIRTEREVACAFHGAAKYGERVLVERHVDGRQYRLCVVGGRLVAAAERIPAYVIADGQHTVEELVALANRNPLRGEGHDKPLTKIEIDAMSVAVLAKQGLTPHLVPEAKRVVQIKETANISTGGTAVDVTALVHPETARLSEYIAKVIGLDVAGLDIIAADIAKPLPQQSGAVIEVNAAPGIRMHHHPSAGQPRDVGGEIVEHLFPFGSDGRIPVVAVTGTNGKTTTVRMIAGILRQAGYKVGMSTTEGVFLNEECLRKGDCSGPMSAGMVLTHPETEAAVLETARGGIIRAGLGFDRCDVAVVTNISDDHLGQDSLESLEDLAHVKSLVLEVAAPSGAAVINADDHFAPKLAARVRSEIVYFSASPDNILVRRHLGAGGKAVFLKNGRIYLVAGAYSVELLQAADIPVTLGGKAAHNIENALAAAAAAYAYGIGMEAIRKGLRSFVHNTGRLNVFRFDDFKVCVDYGHNLAGYQAMLHTARRMESKRLVGVIAAPGDRRDDAIFALGMAAGKGFDRLYIKEDTDLRGRKSGEVAALLESGALHAGFSQADIMTILLERDAVRAALKDAREGDLILIFYECYEAVISVLQNFRQEEALAPTRYSSRPGFLPAQEQEEARKNLHS